MSRARSLMALPALGAALAVFAASQSPATPGAEEIPLEGAPPGSSMPLAAVDSVELGRFVQGHFIEPLRRQQVGGAVLVAVRDGREIFRTTYGHRDVEHALPVDVDHTMFLIASISKTFTASALAQLVSQGLLGYDDPVRSRLKAVDLHSRHAGELQIRHLLTHTTGIPDLFLGASCRSARDCLPLALFLKERQPESRAPPGTFVSYSNFSNALAGQVVADVSGLGYGDYLRRRIFRPLGMLNTCYDVPGEPRADDARANRALGYELEGRRLARSPSNYSMFYPAGQIAASGADMARYMIAQLDGDSFLPDAERLDMQKVHAQNPGFVDGYGWGWSVRTAGDTTVVGHGGDLRGVVSDLQLVPAARFGYFAAITGDAGNVLEEFSRAFRQRYLAAGMPGPAVSAPKANAWEIPSGLEGVYQDFRFAHDDPLQLLSILSETRVRRVTAREVSVALPMLLGAGTYRFAPSEKDELRMIGAPQRHPAARDSKLRVIRDGDGAVRYFVFEDRGYDLAAVKMPAWRQTRFKLPALAILLLAHAVFAVVAVVAFIRGRRVQPHSVADRIAVAAIAVSALAAVVFPVWLGATLVTASKWDLLYGLASLGLKPAYALLPLATLALLAASALWLKARWWSAVARRAYAAAIVLGAGYLTLLAINGQFAHVY